MLNDPVIFQRKFRPRRRQLLKKCSGQTQGNIERPYGSIERLGGGIERPFGSIECPFGTFQMPAATLLYSTLPTFQMSEATLLYSTYFPDA